MSNYLKEPAAEVDYLIDWSIGLDARTIASAAWTVDPVEAGGVAIVDQAIEGARTRVTLGGGVPGHAYRVSALASFSDGRGDVRSIGLRVDAR